MKLGNLVVEISADSTNFVKGADTVEQRLGNVASRARSTVNAFGKYATAATAAGTAMATYLVTSSIDSAKEIRALADVSNTSIKRFGELAYGARQYGIENDKLADILKDVNDRVGDFVATGGGPMQDFFNNVAPKVGVTAAQFRKLSGPDALQLYVSSLEKANLSQQDMTFYMEALSSDSTKLLPLLRNNGDEFARQAEEAQKLGLALSDIEAQKISQASVALDTMGQGLDAVVTKFSAQLSPVIVAISKEFTDAAKDAGGFGNIALDAFDKVISAAAFVADAADGIKRTFQITADGIIAAMSWATKAIASDFAWVLEKISKLPGVDYSETVKSLRELSKESQSIVDQSVNHINKTLSQPMAGDALRQFVEDARKAGDAAAQATIEARQAAAAPSTVPGGAADAETQQQREQLAAKIDAIKQANMTEMELLVSKHQSELEELVNAKEQRLVTEQEYNDLFKETKKRHEEEITAIEKQQADIRKQKAEQEAQAKRQIMSSALNGLTTLMNSKSREMFEIGKAAATAQAVISTYTGMNKALELGWPLGPIAAAAIAAKGFANVQSIQSQSFGGGGGGGGGASTASNTQQVNAANTPVENQQPSQTMFVSGISEGELFTGSRVKSIVGELLEYQRNGGQVILA